MAQVNLAKVTTANNAPVGKLGIFVTPDNEAFLIDENGAVYAFGGGATSFLALTDVPASYVGAALQAVRVNAGATGLEFVAFPEGFDGNPSSLNQEGATDGQAIVWNNIAGQWQPQTVDTGAVSFLDLTDTPANYIGQALKGVRVNAGATALEFVDLASGGVWGTITGTLSDQTDLWTLLDDAVYLTGNQTINGIKTFVSSPIVPNPTTDFQAATKAYVDAATGAASQLVTNQVFAFVTNTVTLDFIPDDMLYVGLNGQLTDEWTRTGDQLTVTNFTEGFIIVGYYKAIVIGGANVETVTGAGVDNTDPANPVIGYQPATLLESNTIPFDKDYIIGNAGFRTGNILFDFTGAELGATVVMRHQDALAFTIPTEAKTLSGTYDGAVDNYLWFVLTDKTAATEIVQLTISQIQP